VITFVEQECNQRVTSNQRIVVVLPAHNEAAVIGDVLCKIPSEIDGMSVTSVVIDDGSSDKTPEIARQNGAMVFRHITNLGVGAATITGLRAARDLNADIVVTMDSDGQHDPDEIQALVRCLRQGPFDVVIGSRILSPEGMPLSRIMANLLLNAVTFVVYRKIVSDSQSGFKAFSRTALTRMKLNASGYEICSEIIGELYRNNLRYKSLPVKAVYTHYSRAKGQHFLNGVNIILGLLMRLMRRV
jgi:UDP-N-acetylglucosamine---dolichyl-phosphate N-acetylglucosaminyltransferase